MKRNTKKMQTRIKNYSYPKENNFRALLDLNSVRYSNRASEK